MTIRVAFQLRRSGLLPILILLVTACSPAERGGDRDELTRTRYLMGTALTITVPDREGNVRAIDAAFDEVARVEALLSTWRDDSELAAVNASPIGEGVVVSSELFDLLEETIEWARATDGAFDPAAGRILFAWDLRADGRVPPPEEIDGALGRSGVEHLELDSSARTVTRHSEVLIEEGGFGKGYALDRAQAVLEAAGIERTMIDFGGQVTISGATPVTVGIAHPENRLDPAVEIEVISGSVATSSGSERFFESSDVRYSHIFDPRTGRALPPRGSVTVIHSSGLVSDILATALYVMGPRDGLAWSDRNDLTAIFVVPGSDGTWRVLPSREANRSLQIRAIDREFRIDMEIGAR